MDKSHEHTIYRTLLLVVAFIICTFSVSALSISSISVVPISDTLCQVNWTTDGPANSLVRYDIDDVLEYTSMGPAQDSELVTDHSVFLAGLSPETMYHLDIHSQAELGDTATADNSGELYTCTTYETVTISNLRVDEITTNSAKIFWSTNIPRTSTVFYGISPDFGSTELSSEEETEHEVMLSGLQKGDKIYYSIKADYQLSETREFDVPYDITPPFITLVVSTQSTQSKTITISGATEPKSKLTYFVNSGNQGQYQTDETGSFTAELSLSNGLNLIRVNAIDEHGNENSTTAEVIVDLAPPKITLVDFEETAVFESINVNVSLDEMATITISHNGNSVISEQNTFLNTRIRLDQDNDNIILITAVDSAGNQANITKEIVKFPPPRIDMIYPNLSRFGHGEGATPTGIPTMHEDQMLEGRSSAPGVTINVFVYNETNNIENAKLYTTTADEKGYWSVEVRLEKTTFLFTESQQRYYGGAVDADSQVIDGIASTMQPTKNYVDIVAVDKFNRSSNEVKLIFNVQQCGTGQDFTVVIEPDEHHFKPYRLKDGTEIMNFKVHLDWNGFGDYSSINSVKIKRQMQTPEMYDDDRYSCFLSEEGNIFRNRERFAKPGGKNKTFWYLSYRLAPWQDLNDTTVTEWGDFFKKGEINKQCWMPLIVEVKYTVRGETAAVQTQETCHLEKRFIDPDVDANLIIPEPLMQGALSVLNATLEVIKVIKAPLEKVASAAQVTCFTSAGLMLVKKANTRLKCSTSSATLESCAKAIESEKKIYNKYRLACDRVWCKDVPVSPSGNDGVETRECENFWLDDNYPKDGNCNDDPRFECLNPSDPTFYSQMDNICGKNAQNVNHIYRPTNDCNVDPQTKNSPSGQQKYLFCCKLKTGARRAAAIEEEGHSVSTIELMKAEEWGYYDSELYAGAGENTKKPVRFDEAGLVKDKEWVAYTNLGGDAKEKYAWDYGLYAGYVTETMGALILSAKKLENDWSKMIDANAPETLKTCYGTSCAFRDLFPQYALLGPVAYISGKRLSSLAKSDILGAGENTKSALRSGFLPADLKRAKIQLSGAEINEENKKKMSDDLDAHSFKDDALTEAEEEAQADALFEGTTMKYVPGLYGTACFNQESVWFSDDCMFQPRHNWFASLQCACITDINGRILQFEQIAEAMQTCLKTVDATGGGGQGACQEVFAEQVCDLFSWLLVKVMQEKAQGKIDDGSADLNYGEAFSMGMQDFFDQLSSDYSTNFKGAMGFNLGSVTHGACMGVLFNQMPPVFEATFSGRSGGLPRQSTAIVYPAKRELLGSDPTTGTAVIEYRMGVAFSAGSRIRFLRVELVCDSEGDCPGQEMIKPFIPINGELPGGYARDIEQNSLFNIGGYMLVEREKIRYNKVRIFWQSYDGVDWSSKEYGKEFPITDVTQLNIVGCTISPTSALDGNKYYECERFDDDSYAEFIEPPRDMILRLESNLEALVVPFTIKTSYGSLTNPESEPYILQYEWLSPGSKVTHFFPLKREGTISSEEATGGNAPYHIDAGIFGSQESSASISKVGTGTGVYSKCEGSQTVNKNNANSQERFKFTLDFDNSIKIKLNQLTDQGKGSDKNEILKLFSFGMDIDDLRWDGTTLSITEAGVVFKYSPRFEDGEQCVFEFVGGSQDNAETIIQLRIGIYESSNSGSQIDRLVTRPVSGAQERTVNVKVQRMMERTDENKWNPKINKIELSSDNPNFKPHPLRYFIVEGQSIDVTVSAQKVDSNQPDISSAVFYCEASNMLKLENPGSSNGDGLWTGTYDFSKKEYCEAKAQVEDNEGKKGNYGGIDAPIDIYVISTADFEAVENCYAGGGECLREAETKSFTHFKKGDDCFSIGNVKTFCYTISDVITDDDTNMFTGQFTSFPVELPPSSELSDNFGDARGTESEPRSHKGIDISQVEGKKVYAALSGNIKYIGCDEYGGNRITISHSAEGINTYYAHLSEYNLDLRVGKEVKTGAIIGYVGKTVGCSDGCKSNDIHDTSDACSDDCENKACGLTTPEMGYHLHFGVYDNSGEFFNPFNALNALL